MKTTESLPAVIGKILDENLQLDMPCPARAKKKVAREIIELFNQQNARLTAINEKQTELIKIYKEQSAYIGEYSSEQLESGLQSLQSEPTAVEIVREAFEPIQRREEEPKHPTSWRDFTMTEKIEEKTIDNCIHFDLCQGRDKCLASQVVSDICIGVDCGHYKDKS